MKTEIAKEYAEKVYRELKEGTRQTDEVVIKVMGALLIALKDPSFVEGYSKREGDHMLEYIYTSVEDVLVMSDLNKERQEQLRAYYKGITRYNYTKAIREEVLIEIVEEVRVEGVTNLVWYEKVYTEILELTGVMGQPDGLIELVMDIAEIDENTKVVIPYTGRGDILLKVLDRAIVAGRWQPLKVARVKKLNIKGIESNLERQINIDTRLVLKDSGAVRIVQGVSSREGAKNISDPEEYDVGITVPEGVVTEVCLTHIRALEDMTKATKEGGMCIGIIPIKALQNTENSEIQAIKKRIQKSNTLEAVMSLKGEVKGCKWGSGMCIVVLTVKEPQGEKPSWFGYLDISNLGETGKEYIKSYKERKDEVGISIKKKVTPEEEWCAEEHIEIDDGSLTEDEFKRKLNEYRIK